MIICEMGSRLFIKIGSTARIPGVHGETLTGLLLPEFKLVSVPSRRDYWREARQRYVQAKSSRDVSPPRQILPDGWDQANEKILEKLTELAQTKSHIILAELEKSPGFPELTPRQQAKVCATVAGSKIPWSALLSGSGTEKSAWISTAGCSRATRKRRTFYTD